MESARKVSAPPLDDSRYRLLVEAITDYAVFMLDPDGFVLSWNPGARRFKGYEAEEIIGHSFSRFYTDEDRDGGLPARALATAAREGRFENEGWRVRKDGSRFWAYVVIDPIRAPSGELIGFAKITRDLTERKVAEEALQRSEERFRILVQGVKDYAIYMLDEGGRVTNWNAGAERIKGYLASEIVGQHFSCFYTGEDQARGEPRRALETAIREGRFENEAWRVRKDGSHFWANVVIDPIRDPSGALIGFAKVTRDMSERKAAQRALEEAREAFFQAQKMEALGQLTGGIAHDFNNLLTAVLGSLELLSKRLPDDPKVKRLLDNAFQGIERGASLTQRMLAFGRRQSLKLETIDVRDLVHGMIDLLDRSLGPSVVIKTRFSDPLDAIRADAHQLELAILNLAMNARDAMPRGGTVTIAARLETLTPGHESRLGPGRYVCLSVADRGEGMDEATLARATEPFFTTKGVGKGTGLGLSMVLGLTEQLGGRLVLKSKKGEGTTAELWLPLAAASDEPVRDAQQGAPAAALGSGVRPLTILVVDDDSLVLGNTAAMLEDIGHTTFEAGSATEALSILDEAKVDLVVTDLAMPHMTGLELASVLRHERPDLSVIVMTGFADLAPETAADLRIVLKPFGCRELEQAIAETMEADEPRRRRQARTR